jgi:hypothetical protein
MGLWNGPVRLILRIRSEACTAEPTAEDALYFLSDIMHNSKTLLDTNFEIQVIECNSLLKKQALIITPSGSARECNLN